MDREDVTDGLVHPSISSSIGGGSWFVDKLALVKEGLGKMGLPGGPFLCLYLGSRGGIFQAVVSLFSQSHILLVVF